MLKTRILVAIAALPVMVAVINTGGILFRGGVAMLLALGIWELVMLGKAEGYQPSLVVALIIMGVLVLSVDWPGLLGPGLVIGVLLGMVASLYHFHRGDRAPLNSFSITVGVALLVGWLGTYLLHLRNLPEGGWWTLLVLLCIFAADTGAYLIGKPFGRHKMSPLASPKKSWEGYFGGVAFAAGFGSLFAALWHLRVPVIRWEDGLLLGLLIALVVPLGDLTISMFKRQARIKDASRLIPGHGGIMDRLDTVLVGAALGFYYIIWFT